MKINRKNIFEEIRTGLETMKYYRPKSYKNRWIKPVDIFLSVAFILAFWSIVFYLIFR